jgi:hypothetical protein
LKIRRRESLFVPVERNAAVVRDSCEISSMHNDNTLYCGQVLLGKTEYLFKIFFLVIQPPRPQQPHPAPLRRCQIDNFLLFFLMMHPNMANLQKRHFVPLMPNITQDKIKDNFVGLLFSPSPDSERISSK